MPGGRSKPLPSEIVAAAPRLTATRTIFVFGAALEHQNVIVGIDRVV